MLLKQIAKHVFWWPGNAATGQPGEMIEIFLLINMHFKMEYLQKYRPHGSYSQKQVGRLNMKVILPVLGSHAKDKTVSWLSYL